MGAGPEPPAENPIIELLERYRIALNYSIFWIVRSSVKSGRRYRVPGISEIHRGLYDKLRDAFNLPSRIAIECYREALAIARPYLGKGPTAGSPGLEGYAQNNI